MAQNITQKLIEGHLLDGNMAPGEEIGIRIDQTLTQDATGTLVMLAFEAMNIGTVKTELSVQYVDHNLLQEDYKNPDDHLFLSTVCPKHGMWYSPPGNGVSHPVHQECFGVPGKTMVGSDSHTPAAGAIGMFAVGAGGLEVALAMAGEPLYFKMPEVLGVELTGELPEWVSAKDVVLEMLRRYDVNGGVGKVIEYYGPGLKSLSAMDRHVIANMGTEMGATTSLFPSDEMTQQFFRQQGRESEWVPLAADKGAGYDSWDSINLSELVPLIATPSSPGNVVPVEEVAGEPVYQTYIGSSANPGMRDFAISALILDNKRADPKVSLDINPASRQILENLTSQGYLGKLIHAGARIHQAGCNGCIGMGQAPATDKNSLRTVPRNFPGRSGTREDRVFLCSPETAAASATTGQITDPRTLNMPYPRFEEPDSVILNREMLVPPAKFPDEIEVVKGPNIAAFPELKPLSSKLKLPVLLKMKNNISTDEILPAGARVLPFRSNIPKISEFCFDGIIQSFASKTQGQRDDGFAAVAGENYGQGSSREHAALAPRYLGLRTVLAKSFARIHRQNLINFGVLPLVFDNPDDYDDIDDNEILIINISHDSLNVDQPIEVVNTSKESKYLAHHHLSSRQIEVIKAGSLIAYIRKNAS